MNWILMGESQDDAFWDCYCLIAYSGICVIVYIPTMPEHDEIRLYIYNTCNIMILQVKAKV